MCGGRGRELSHGWPEVMWQELSSPSSTQSLDRLYRRGKRAVQANQSPTRSYFISHLLCVCVDDCSCVDLLLFMLRRSIFNLVWEAKSRSYGCAHRTPAERTRPQSSVPPSWGVRSCLHQGCCQQNREASEKKTSVCVQVGESVHMYEGMCVEQMGGKRN